MEGYFGDSSSCYREIKRIQKFVAQKISWLPKVGLLHQLNSSASDNDKLSSARVIDSLPLERQDCL